MLQEKICGNEADKRQEEGEDDIQGAASVMDRTIQNHLMGGHGLLLPLLWRLSVNANNGQRYNFDPEKMILSSRYNIYWIEHKGKKKAFKNFKQFLKLYPKKQEELQRFIKENKVDFNDVQQISRLCIHAGSL